MKVSRHAKILELIEKYDIETQDELAEKLRQEGFDVTQATVSRDIREMGLPKFRLKRESKSILRWPAAIMKYPTGL